MPEAHGIDIAIVVVFFVTCLIFGIVLARRQKGFATFVLAERRLGFLHAFGTIVSTIAGFSIVFAHAIYGYMYGISVMWSPPAVLVAFLLFAVFVPRLKEAADRNGYETYADMLLRRYDRKTQILGSILTVLNFLALAAINVYGIGLILSTLLGWSFQLSVLFGAGIVVTYVILGGFWAVVWTDLLQMFVTIAGLLVLLPITYAAVSKVGGLRLSLPEEYFAAGTWGLDKIIGVYVVVIPVLFSSQDIWQRVFAAKDVRTARNAVIAGGILISVGAAVAVYLGMCSRALMPDIDSEYALPRLITQVLPAGAVGLLMVGYLAAFTSSADSFLLVISSAVSKDLLRSDKQQEKAVAVTRVVTLLCGVVVIGIIMAVPDIVKILFTVLTWLMILVPATLAGFFWKRATATAAFWSILAGWVIAILYAILTGDAETAGVVAAVPTVAILIILSKLSRSKVRSDSDD